MLLLANPLPLPRIASGSVRQGATDRPIDGAGPARYDNGRFQYLTAMALGRFD